MSNGASIMQTLSQIAAAVEAMTFDERDLLLVCIDEGLSVAVAVDQYAPSVAVCDVLRAYHERRPGNSAADRALDAWRRVGIRIAIDDAQERYIAEGF